MPAIHANLTASGALLHVTIAVSALKEQALRAANLPVPQPITGNFVVDTGAAVTCADAAFIARLGLTPTGTTSIQTPATGANVIICNQFDVSMFIHGNTGAFRIPAIPIVATSLKWRDSEGLIGRDILDNATLIYNGTAKMMTLAF